MGKEAKTNAMRMLAVSYTHLDVYKRQDTSCTRSISGWVVQYLAAAYRRLW